MSRPEGGPDAEVIVVGAGHNGLICAAYLARAGIDTLLVDARPDVGGLAATVTDLDARFNICNCDHVLVRGMPVADELDLAAHGLTYVEPEIASIHRFHDPADAPWLFFHDIDRHLDALAATYPAQIAGYRRYLSDAVPVAELALALARTHPSARGFASTLVSRRGAGAARLLRWSRASVDDVLSQYFDDWRVTMPAVSTGPTVWGTRPDAPGTGTAAALYATRHLVQGGRPTGGSGALTEAVRASFEAAGGRVTTGRCVDRVLLDDGAVTGIGFVDGEQLRARRVVAACDPRRVFLDWIAGAPAAAQRLVDRYRSQPEPHGYESKLDLVLDGLPRWRDQSVIEALAPGADSLAPTTVIAPRPDQLAEAHRLRLEGAVADRPTLLVNVPTTLDPAMQPQPDQHVMSVEVLFTPYGLAGGWPGSGEPERWLEILDGFMDPGSLRIDRWRAMTPDRYEREFLMHRGHTPAYSETPLAALIGRRREVTRYRTPINGLYLSGAGTFPGAGVFGAPGRNAAAAVRDDVESGARRVRLRR